MIRFAKIFNPQNKYGNVSDIGDNSSYIPHTHHMPYRSNFFERLLMIQAHPAKPIVILAILLGLLYMIVCDVKRLFIQRYAR